MDYAVVKDGIIENVIVIEDEKYAEVFHALPLKEGQGIGDTYEPPEEIVPRSVEDRVDDLETAVGTILDVITQ